MSATLPTSSAGQTLSVPAMRVPEFEDTTPAIKALHEAFRSGMVTYEDIQDAITKRQTDAAVRADADLKTVNARNQLELSDLIKEVDRAKYEADKVEIPAKSKAALATAEADVASGNLRKRQAEGSLKLADLSDEVDKMQLEAEKLKIPVDTAASLATTIAAVRLLPYTLREQVMKSEGFATDPEGVLLSVFKSAVENGDTDAALQIYSALKERNAALLRAGNNASGLGGEPEIRPAAKAPAAEVPVAPAEPEAPGSVAAEDIVPAKDPVETGITAMTSSKPSKEQAVMVEFLSKNGRLGDALGEDGKLLPPAELKVKVDALTKELAEAEKREKSLKENPPLTAMQRMEADSDVQGLDDMVSLMERVKSKTFETAKDGKILRDARGRARNKVNVSGPLTGWDYNPMTYLESLFTPTRRNHQFALEQLHAKLTMQNTKALKGPLSEKELAFLKRAVPNSTHDESVWADYIEEALPVWKSLRDRKKAGLGGTAEAPAPAAASAAVPPGDVVKVPAGDEASQAKFLSSLKPGTLYQLPGDTKVRRRGQ